MRTTGVRRSRRPISASSSAVTYPIEPFAMNHCIFQRLMMAVGCAISAPALSVANAAVRSLFGLEKRIPWTTSRVVGSPEPPTGYRTERVFSKIKLERPVDAEGSPDGKWWLVGQEFGHIVCFANDPTVGKTEEFLDLTYRDPKLGRPTERHHLWSFTFHPKFAENGYVFACYRDELPQPQTCKIVRFHVDLKNSDQPPKCDPASEKLILEWPAGEDHWGGCLKFGAGWILVFLGRRRERLCRRQFQRPGYLRLSGFNPSHRRRSRRRWEGILRSEG